jgi:hypothetical protein
VERQRARRLAGLRFSVVVVGLLVLSIVLVFAVWQQVQRLFGI